MLDLFTLPSVNPRHGRDIPHQQTFFGIPTRTRRLSDDAPAIVESQTSRAAGRRVRPHAASIRDRVIKFIIERGAHGATDHEIAATLRILPDTARSRRVKLRDEGVVHDGGRRRSSPSGCSAVVWVAAEDMP